MTTVFSHNPAEPGKPLHSGISSVQSADNSATATNPNGGFTLLEVMIALGVASLVLLGLMRFYSTMLKSYSLQDQLTEMNQNGKYVVKELSEILSQAGADCMAINSDSTD